MFGILRSKAGLAATAAAVAAVTGLTSYADATNSTRAKKNIHDIPSLSFSEPDRSKFELQQVCIHILYSSHEKSSHSFFVSHRTTITPLRAFFFIICCSFFLRFMS